MKREPSLKQSLRSVAARMRLKRLAHRMLWALMVGLIPAVLHLALAKTGLLYKWRLDFWPQWASFVPVGLAAVAGAVWGALGRVTDFEAAHLADRALGLKERLGSAVALSNFPPENRAFLAEILEDARRHARELNAAAAVGALLPRRAYVAPVLGVVMAALWFMPQYRLFTSPEEQRQRTAVEQQGNRLLDIAREARREAESTNLDRTQKITQEIEMLAHNLASGRTGKREAMKELAELTDEVRAEHARIAQTREVQEFRDALQEVSQGQLSSESVSRIVESMAAGDVKAAREQLEGLQKKLEGGDLSSAEMQELASDLEKVSEALEGTSAADAAKAMRNAAENMKQGDGQQASEALQEAAEQMAQSDAARGLSEMEQLESLARELEFSEDQVAREHNEAPGGG